MDILVPVKGGQQEHARVRPVFTDSFQSVDARSIGHVQIQQGQVGPMLGVGRDGLGHRGGFGHDLKVRAQLQHRPQPLAEQFVIVGNENTDHEKSVFQTASGKTTSTQEPPPTTDFTASEAPSNWARSRMSCCP